MRLSAISQAAGVALPFVVSPGASLTLTVHHAAAGRRRAALPVAVGTVAGLFTLAGILALSPAAELLAAHPSALRPLGLVGAAILATLGARVVVRAGRRPPTLTDDDPPQPRASDPALVRQAYATLVLNPKALALYLVVVPALGRGGPAPYISFACVHSAMHVVWLALVGALVARLPGGSSDPLRRGLSLAAGGFLLFSAIQVWRATW